MERPYHIAEFLKRVIECAERTLGDLDRLENYASQVLSAEKVIEMKNGLHGIPALGQALQWKPGGLKSHSEERREIDNIQNSLRKFQSKIYNVERMPTISEINVFRRECQNHLERLEYYFANAQQREWRDFNEHGGI